MLFKKKNKDPQLSQSSPSSENALSVGGRPKGLFTKQIDVPVANIDFGFQRFSSDEPSPVTLEPFEPPAREDSPSGELPSVSHEEPFSVASFMDEAAIDLTSLNTEEILPPPDFVSPDFAPDFASDLPSPLHLEAPSEFEIPAEDPSEPVPEFLASPSAELSPEAYTLPPFTVGDPFLADTPLETFEAEREFIQEVPEPVAALEWGKEPPGIVDVPHVEATLPPFPQPIHTPQDMHLASESLEMPSFSGASLSGPSIDDFWVHYAPDFEEVATSTTPSLEGTPASAHNAAEFLDSVQHQLYPSSESMLSLAEAAPPSLDPIAVNDEPLLSEPMVSYGLLEDTSEDYPSFSLDFDETSPQQDTFAAAPQEASETLGAQAAELSQQSGLEDLEILAMQPLDVDKTLMLVSFQATYALMGQLNGEISVLKLFPQNPLEANGGLFTVSREGSIGNQALYHIQLGHWQAVLKVDPQSIQLQTEL